jgi:hypothetical protein
MKGRLRDDGMLDDIFVYSRILVKFVRPSFTFLLRGGE